MSKVESDGLSKLDINWLVREKMIQKNCWNNRNITWTHHPSGHQSSITIHTSLTEQGNHVDLIYTTTDRWDGTKKDFNYRVPLTSTPCNLGGCRYWFVCPLTQNGIYCGRRVGKLYFSGKYFGCRHCHDLTYECRNAGGLFKRAGVVISEPDLEKERLSIKKKHYRGKMTRRFRRYLKRDQHARRQLMVVIAGLSENDPYKHYLT